MKVIQPRRSDVRQARTPLAAPVALSLSWALGGMATAAVPPGTTGIVASAEHRTSATPAHTPLRYDMDYPTIGYADPPHHNAIARLQERLERGEAKLEFKGPRGYLDSLLKALKIDPSSQVLVYSKTSQQIDWINAATPRAIYFNDDAYVAWVQGSDLLEMSVMDDDVGAVFYTLPNREVATPPFERQTSQCLTCHDTFAMAGGGVPRFLIASTVVDTDGIALQEETSHETDDTTPLADRWGGWYVTGQPDNEVHLGNLMFRPGQRANARRQHRGTLASVGSLFDTKPYITDKSDIVALLVLEHQLEVKNLITRLNFKARSFLARDAAARAPEQVTYANASPRTQTAIRSMVNQLVRAMLFENAAQYRGRIGGTSGFDKWFDAQGPRDPQGRSLRDFDLRTRLFKYPLSYVIYSDGFNALPAYVKGRIYARLREVLSGEDAAPEFRYLAPSDRTAILQILTATKPDFAATAALAQR